jgi:hypothetical protein
MRSFAARNAAGGFWLTPGPMTALTCRLGDAPRTLVAELAKMKSDDVVLPAQMGDGSARTIHLRCVTTPDEAQKVLLEHFQFCCVG